jgi:hypothetical protein
VNQTTSLELYRRYDKVNCYHRENRAASIKEEEGFGRENLILDG